MRDYYMIAYIEVDQDCIKKIIKDLNIPKNNKYFEYEYESDDFYNYNDDIVSKYFEIKNIITDLKFYIEYVKDINFFELITRHYYTGIYKKEEYFNDNERYKKYLSEKFNFCSNILINSINSIKDIETYITNITYFLQNNKNTPLHEYEYEYKEFIEWLKNINKICYNIRHTDS